MTEERNVNPIAHIGPYIYISLRKAQNTNTRPIKSNNFRGTKFKLTREPHRRLKITADKY